VQYLCFQSNELLEQKRKDAAIVSGTSVFSALFFMITIYYMRQATALNKVDWDVASVTAGDYTVEFDTLEIFNKFKQTDFQRYSGDSIGLAFEKFICSELERILTEQVPSQGYENVSRVRIADIQFTYKNAVLIKLLTKRGTCIKNADWAGLKKADAEV